MSRHDNHGEASGRLYGVAEQQPGEGELRRALAAQAARVPGSGSDLAAVAVARARRIQWRRRVTALAGVVVATVLATGALVRGLPEPDVGGGSTYTGLFGGPDATVAAEPPEPVEARLVADQAVAEQFSVEMIGAGNTGGLVLATVDGQVTDLGPIGDVTSAHRVGDGWAVVSGTPGTARLWWVTADDPPTALLSGMDAVAVTDRQVAWRRGAMLSAAVLSGGGDLVERVDTQAPEGDGLPVGFAGDAVLLARAGAPGADVWRPSRDPYRPGWTSGVVRVYGAVPGEPKAVGLVSTPSADRPCLAELSVGDGIDVSRYTCGPDLAADGEGSISPDGRWLVAEAGSPDGSVVVDLDSALAEQPDAVAAAGGGAAPTGVPVWLAPDQAVYPTGGSVIKLGPERVIAGAPDGVEEVPRSGSPLVIVRQ